MNRTGLLPVECPFEIILMQSCGYIHTGVPWVLCMFFDQGNTRYRTRTLKGSVRFVRVYVDFIRARKHPYDYVCERRAGPCGCHKRALKYPYDQSCRAIVGPMGPVTAHSCYIYQIKHDYVLFDP